MPFSYRYQEMPAMVTVCYLNHWLILRNLLIHCKFLCYLEKCVYVNTKYFFFNTFLQNFVMGHGSSGKIQVIMLVPYTEQNHCLEVASNKNVI